MLRIADRKGVKKNAANVPIRTGIGVEIRAGTPYSGVLGPVALRYLGRFSG